MIYIRIKENLNDTVVKLFFSMKTSVDNASTLMYTDFEKLPWKMGMTSWRYVVINKCIVSCLHIWKMVPLGVNLKIKYSISLFSILNRVAIWMYFAFKQGQNWRVLAPHTQPNFIPIPSSSSSPLEKFLPLCITIILQQNRFFSELNKKQGMEQRGLNSDLPWSRHD